MTVSNFLIKNYIPITASLSELKEYPSLPRQ